jgi:hypothetical protein
MHTTHRNGTVIRCGVYTDGAPKQLGQWHTTMAAQRVDVGNVGSYLAAKDMWDPSKGACGKTPAVEPFLESPL